MDESVRRALRPALERVAVGLAAIGLTPHVLTALGLVLGIGAAVAAATGRWWTALVLWLVSRVHDGLDGVLARLQGVDDEVGGFLDLMADFAAYGGFVVGIAVGVPEVRLACAVLLLSYYLNGSAFLAISSLAERRGRRVVDGERSLQFVRGLTEGVETILAHAVFAITAALRPEWLEALLYGFAVLVGITFVQRLLFGVRALRH